MEKTSQPKKLLKWAVSIALVIVINLFFHYIIELVYPEPTFEKFCPMNPVQYVTAETCVASGGQWTNNQFSPQEITKAVKDGQPLGYCDANFTCNQNFNDAHSVYNRNAFVVLVILSIIVLAAGVFIPVEVLSMGFSWAGVVSLIVATFKYWSDANNIMRVVILIIALAMLIWLAIKKLRE
jgi:hypothetical protein